MIVNPTSLIAFLGVLAGVAVLSPSKAQAQCTGGGYYEPTARVVYNPPVYYGAPTYYAPQPRVVYYDSPRVYRSYSVGVNIGHHDYRGGHAYYGHDGRNYGRDYGHRRSSHHDRH